MEKFLNDKNLKWTKKDIVLNVVVFFVNYLVLVGMMLGFLGLTSLDESAISIGVVPFIKSEHFVNFLVLLFLIQAFFYGYYFFGQADFIKFSSNTEMMFLILEVSLALQFFTGKYVSIFVRPYAIATVLTIYLVDHKNAIFMNVVFNLIMLLFDYFSGAFIGGFNKLIYLFVLGLTSGAIALVVFMGVYSRLKLILRGLLLGIPNAVLILCPLIWVGGFGVSTLSEIAYSLCSGLITSALALIFVSVFEGLFNKVSTFRYAELTDHKSPIIKKMMEQAPGTYNHSIIVSNIAEACASAIGEDALLARTCAYYHDIGKLRRPEFFKENQIDSEDLHKDLTPELSANIIKAHAEDGYKLAKKNRLPKAIADVCLEHHGTMPILFFYDKAKKFTDGEVDISEFCYNGPKPQSKIAAIIMIADGCEAATRSLKNRSRESVANVVKKTIDSRIKLGQLEECEITFKELNIIGITIVNTLTGVYHKRIEYPKININDIEKELEDEIERKDEPEEQNG